MGVEVVEWEGMEIVRVSSVGREFEEWLNGKVDTPLVESAQDPYDWAYYQDYVRFTDGRG